MPKKEKRKRNITGIVVASLYCIAFYAIIIESAAPNPPNNPFWVYALIPIGAIIITFLFDYVIKYDFFDEEKRR
ncbi:hypothetical protein [Saccharibacillus kuerlensis]|uniref:Uncharacterized protein n=1 Tax=Saccharibacillus kuerlensis TaxID=459527 RepID=A0ABQ2L404_9BACL|nr:hypothetical protein [Saccharibacillus kuerlensis]GGO01840.1 hypothetical protein GCM10010969_24530 [Saccharibacillus kuerlensis]